MNFHENQHPRCHTWSAGRTSVSGAPEGRNIGWMNGRPSGVSISKFQIVFPSRARRTPVGVFSHRKRAFSSTSGRRRRGVREVSSSSIVSITEAGKRPTRLGRTAANAAKAGPPSTTSTGTPASGSGAVLKILLTFFETRRAPSGAAARVRRAAPPSAHTRTLFPFASASAARHDSASVAFASTVHSPLSASAASTFCARSASLPQTATTSGPANALPASATTSVIVSFFIL